MPITVPHQRRAGSPPPGQGGEHEQLDLLAAATEVEQDTAAGGDQAPPLTTAEKFAHFDAANPRVYMAYEVLTRMWVRRTGGKRIGIGALTERVRWEIAISTDDPEFKINNNFRPFYVRKLIRDHPEWADLFELRRSIADQMYGEERHRAA